MFRRASFPALASLSWERSSQKAYHSLAPASARLHAASTNRLASDPRILPAAPSFGIFVSVTRRRTYRLSSRASALIMKCVLMVKSVRRIHPLSAPPPLSGPRPSSRPHIISHLERLTYPGHQTVPASNLIQLEQSYLHIFR
jgi:hypothetical protein